MRRMIGGGRQYITNFREERGENKRPPLVVPEDTDVSFSLREKRRHKKESKYMLRRGAIEGGG
jgi:hypothetical protein